MLAQLSYGENTLQNYKNTIHQSSLSLQKLPVLHDSNKNKDGSLKVNKGIDQPTSFNPDAKKRLAKTRKQSLDAASLMNGILNGNRTLLSRAITLVESSLSEHHQVAQQVIEKCIPHSGNSIRVGITGVPGVGKSTFIEALGLSLTKKGHKLAVLAIDPSSEKTKGSILGDKTRMEDLSNDHNAFIRPSPSAGSLGGVARKTKEIIVLCEAAGFDIIFVETVGVGQSETAVHSMVDFFLLLMLAGAGDELQGIKRGIMEMADAIVINKADGDNIDKAKMASKEYENALHLYPPAPSGWFPIVKTCSARTKSGIDEVWETIEKYIQLTKENGFFKQKRQEQELRIMFESIHSQLQESFYSDARITKLLNSSRQRVLSGQVSAYREAAMLLEKYFGKK
ncbi:MAG: methylmalonyl Co-A mutase-associated GTPase MeaB [Bacteroidales bacterium]|nr:methylmalonyl Co-A mutase-associated GTPase MeaB [Bacteroidales bacterium]